MANTIQCDCIETCITIIVEQLADSGLEEMVDKAKSWSTWDDVFPEATQPTLTLASPRKSSGSRGGAGESEAEGEDEEEEGLFGSDESDSDFDPMAKDEEEGGEGGEGGG